MTKNYIIECCIDSVESALIAQHAGAGRLELCSALFEGGLTPSYGMIKKVKEHTSIPVSIMIRPRGGDFCYSTAEFEVMKEDIQMAKRLGADQLVFGLLRPNGTIDVERCTILIALAGTTPVTFHRAFDLSSQLEESLEAIIALGYSHLLTSGQEASVAEGKEALKKIVALAGNRITIMPGAGFTARNFEQLSSFIGASQYHVTMSYEVGSKMEFRRSDIFMGGALRMAEFSYKQTSGEMVGALIP